MNSLIADFYSLNIANGITITGNSTFSNDLTINSNLYTNTIYGDSNF